MSGAGKSLVVAGLCRILRQDGVKVCPFKSQNMALNSYVTKEGLEMGRAQVMQAEAAKAEPSVYMNPILLKPTDDQGSQVIVNGKSIGNMRARDYFKYKKNLIPDIMAAIDKLKEEYEVIIIEGAGSPAEINLKENDIVNMGMAALVDAPVLLVGDIDRGGVFAQLLGTLELLESDERERVKGLIVNKFRGDKTILDPGIEMLEERGRVPVAGVLPYIKLNLEDEDSLTDRFDKRRRNLINIGVIRLPRISNFTDFDVFEQVDSTGVEYITRPNELKNVDLLIIPGSKNTIDDMKWLKETGLESAVKKYAAKGGPVIGICGGYLSWQCRG
jgi:cobyric acid synthase CobQ